MLPLQICLRVIESKLVCDCLDTGCLPAVGLCNPLVIKSGHPEVKGVARCQCLPPNFLFSKRSNKLTNRKSTRQRMFCKCACLVVFLFFCASFYEACLAVLFYKRTSEVRGRLTCLCKKFFKITASTEKNRRGLKYAASEGRDTL